MQLDLFSTRQRQLEVAIDELAERFFNLLGGLCVGFFEIADSIDDVVPLGGKRPANGFSTLPAPITATLMILLLSTPTTPALCQ